MKTTHLLYLHGFRSSPRSTKARLMAERMQREHPGVVWACPQLPPSPAAAMELIRALTAGWPRESMAVVGSSLGGCYAARLAVEIGCARLVLINPAVHPSRDLAKYIGEQSHWHDPQQNFHFGAGHIDELRAIETFELPQLDRCLLIAAKGDEVLDWREMVARFPGAQRRLVEGGDHALSDFESTHLGAVIEFLQPE